MRNIEFVPKAFDEYKEGFSLIEKLLYGLVI